MASPPPGSSGAAPLNIGRVLLPMNYLTSLSVATAQCCAHVYVIAENENRLPPGRKPQKRLCMIADRSTYQSDLDVAISRAVMFSQITEMSVIEEHLAPLTGPFSEYDTLLQQSSSIDFIRTFAAVYKPQSGAVPIYVIEEGQVLTHRVHCRLSPQAFQDVVGTVAQESALRHLRTQKDREIAALQEALQKQKDESLLEMVDLHTQNESLKHSLAQAEQCLTSTRRAAKEERDLLVAKVRQLEAERELRSGRPVGGVFEPTTQSYMPTGYSSTPQQPNGGYEYSSMAAAAAPSPSAAGGVPDYVFSRPDLDSTAMGARPLSYGGRDAVSTSFATARTPAFGGGGTPPPAQRGNAAGGYPSGRTPQQSPSFPTTPASVNHSSSNAPVGRSPQVALEQLQRQLSEGERFLNELGKKTGRPVL